MLFSMHTTRAFLESFAHSSSDSEQGKTILLCDKYAKFSRYFYGRALLNYSGVIQNNENKAIVI